MKNCVLEQFKTGNKNEKKKFELSNSLFEKADLTGTIFSLCELKEINFQKANLENAVFDKCNLTRANLIDTNINGTTFNDCKIENTILDLEGFITYGNSKGFMLEQAKLI
jgi:uncharacterized protein YjbI with pentapeptide repeats